jgi:hypothetical protein
MAKNFQKLIFGGLHAVQRGISTFALGPRKTTENLDRVGKQLN